ncbi:MAG: DUF2911 domain-containing protein [Bacteroidota bacterium]
MTSIFRSLLFFFIFAAAIAVIPAASFAQDGSTDRDVVPAPDARQSPLVVASTRLADDTYVRVVYGSPRMRGRTIFGGLVPFGEVWRTGANEATELTVSQPILFGGERIEAGTYSLFTIPGPESWTVVLNSRLGQWGAYEYAENLDVLRIDVPVEEASARHEAFTVRFDTDDDDAEMVLVWDRTKVSVPLETL